MAVLSGQVTGRQRAAGVSVDLVAAIMWGFTGIFVAYAQAAPLILTFYRLWISTLLMVGVLLVRRRRIAWKVLARIAPSGVLLCTNLACYVYAFKLTTIADASVIGALQPALVLVAAGFLFHEQVGTREVLLTAVAIVGVAGTARFDWNALDAWYEEDEQIFVHPRNPYVRVDALRSHRRVRASLEGVTLADTTTNAPALASNGTLYLAWKGDGNTDLNVEKSTDGGASFSHKYTSAQTSNVAPALCVLDGSIFLAWTGVSNDQLNVARVSG